jgi:hypothetical protein
MVNDATGNREGAIKMPPGSKSYGGTFKSIILIKEQKLREMKAESSRPLSGSSHAAH